MDTAEFRQRVHAREYLRVPVNDAPPLGFRLKGRDLKVNSTHFLDAAKMNHAATGRVWKDALEMWRHVIVEQLLPMIFTVETWASLARAMLLKTN